MKILYLTHAQYVTVALPKVIEQVEAVGALGHSVTLVATSKKGGLKIRHFDVNGIHYITTPSLLWGKLRHGADPLDTIVRITEIRKERFDVVHAVDSRPTVILPAMYIKKRTGCPIIIEWADWFGHGGTISERSSWLYGVTLGRVETFFEEYFRKYGDRAIVISTMLRNRLLDLGYPEEKILLQRPGCDTRKFKGHTREYCREKLKLPLDATVFCYIGSIYTADRELLLRSLEILRGQQPGRNIITVLVGGDHALDSAIVDRLNLIVTGRIETSLLYEYLGATDLALLPLTQSLANKARWPSKFTEYVNAGCPTVATRVSDFEILFPRHNLGFLADDDSPESFARAIGDALDTDPAQLQEIRTACRVYAEQHLDVKHIAQQRVELYEQALTNHGHARGGPAS